MTTSDGFNTGSINLFGGTTPINMGTTGEVKEKYN
jgi:hypothetical protein